MSETVRILGGVLLLTTSYLVVDNLLNHFIYHNLVTKILFTAKLNAPFDKNSGQDNTKQHYWKLEIRDIAGSSRENSIKNKARYYFIRGGDMENSVAVIKFLNSNVQTIFARILLFVWQVIVITFPSTI